MCVRCAAGWERIHIVLRVEYKFENLFPVIHAVRDADGNVCAEGDRSPSLCTQLEHGVGHRRSRFVDEIKKLERPRWERKTVGRLWEREER